MIRAAGIVFVVIGNAIQHGRQHIALAAPQIVGIKRRTRAHDRNEEHGEIRLERPHDEYHAVYDLKRDRATILSLTVSLTFATHC